MLYLGGDNLYGSRRDPFGEALSCPSTCAGESSGIHHREYCFNCLIRVVSGITGRLQCLCGNVRVVSWQSATSKPSGMHQCEARDYDVTSLHPLIQ
ncbi:hypothetical protein HBH56_166550 [Parastagonospora nodorum]|uniref:Uncharacterized protein n=1 Tax=Phaeosphaeria nodorum (strain SN15 / ATCC MYA-4574 / FGSC 10173) TaxID=321614 RepID=A0A7U2F8Q8_PHANO|nr:hypothetical protein HBH56_166550 [Parastagonospora nodorum]QRC98555.1 hypothetical protein JI435_412260 [Parastagonospora nodorum SN15]KAH3936044.1 hypothetical protein HBH54_029630 [Parastagonospora nodorum]KAH3968835.1 hypothetical protein HBH51_128340 [Parastagonospora nodorum]KAH3989512.1 hypothetical protein HBH52_013620 [Parastagonospora nodorum]